MKYGSFLLVLIISTNSLANIVAVTDKPTVLYKHMMSRLTLGPSNMSDLCSAYINYKLSLSTLYTYKNIIYYDNHCRADQYYVKDDVFFSKDGIDAQQVVTHSYSCPSGYYFSDYLGNKNSNGLFCTKICSGIYAINEGSECVAYCKSGTSLVNGECQGNDNTAKPQTQCKEQGADPVLIEDGSLYAPESPDYADAHHFPLQFSRTYHGHNSPYIPANITNNLTLFKTYLTNVGWKRYVQPAGYTGLPKTSIIYIDSTPRLLSGGEAIEVPKVPGYGYQLWRNNFSYTLDVSNTSRVLLVPPLRDDKVVFVGSDTELTANNLSGETLTKNTDEAGVVTWFYRDRTNFVRVFNAKGLLITEQDVSGLSHHLTYDVANRLSSVADDFGHSLSFSYDDYGRISVMTTPAGSVTYGYDDKGNLTTVTKAADFDTTTRTYIYDDSRFSYALTGIIDEKGVRYTSWTYDDMGRITDNYGINSAEKTTFAYNSGGTIVINPLGKSDVYTYASRNGTRRLVSVTGQASTSCLAANSNYSYYDNGLLKSKTDWKGQVTAYEYNGRGLVTKVTEAQGTANARVTTTEWHSIFALPVKVTQGNQSVTYSYDSQRRLTGQQVIGQ